MSEQKDKILAVALKLYLQDGLKGLSMRNIAKEMGLSATALYRHFTDKKSLILNMIESGFQIFGSYLFSAGEGKTPLERLQLTGEFYARFSIEQQQYYKLIFMTDYSLFGYEEADFEPMINQGNATKQILIDRVEDCMRNGIFKKDNAEEIALSIWAHAHGLVSLYLGCHLEMNDQSFTQLFKTSFQHMFQGLVV